MHVGRRSRAPTPGRICALGAAAFALLLGLGSCGQSPTDAGDRELLELNRDRERVQFLGGQTGDGTGVAEDHERESLGEPCSEGNTSRPLLQTEVVPEIDMSADDVIAWAREGVRSSLRWAPAGDLATLPETGDGSVALGFEYQGAGIRLHTPGRIVSYEGRPTCSSWIEVDVTGTLTTPGGALAERFPATLRASRARVIGFSGSIPADELAGTLVLEATGSAGQLDRFEIRGTLTEHGSYGALVARYRSGSAAVVEQRTVAAWPRVSECPPGIPGTAVPLGDDVTIIERSVADWKRRFADVGVTALRWSDGARTRVAFDIQANSAACYSTSWALPHDNLQYGVQILALSDDRRWDGAYLGLVRVISREVPPSTYTALAVKATVPPEQAQSLGVALSNIADAESLTLDLQMGGDVRANEPIAGELQVTASREVDCVELPEDQLDSCLAGRIREVARARFGDGAD